jgi:CheY-like chemotaxis protein
MTRTVLLVDAGADALEDLAARLRGLGYRAVRAKSVEEALAVLADERFVVGAALVPPDLPALDLERALRAFRTAQPDETFSLVAVGRRPDADQRARMRRAGVEWALWRPVDDHTLRFQVNRALAGGGPIVSNRRALRVPTNWPVKLALGPREKPANLYCLSACGAYLTTSRPSMPRALLHVSLPLPEGDVRVAGRVVLTNVPGNLAKAGLPVGMAVSFTGHPPETERLITAWAEERAEALRV